VVIEVLVCRPDGTQSIEPREVPDNWFDEPEEEAGETAEE
jgi:hypothetical protein